MRRAVKLSPGDANLLTSLGAVLGMEGDLREANIYLAKAVQLDPQDPAARRNLVANDWQLGRLKEAHEILDRLLRENSQDKAAIYLLGAYGINIDKKLSLIPTLQLRGLRRV